MGLDVLDRVFAWPGVSSKHPVPKPIGFRNGSEGLTIINVQLQTIVGLDLDGDITYISYWQTAAQNPICSDQTSKIHSVSVTEDE